MTKISVIIPVYNTEKYLKECLESTVNQTFKDIEIICIDDGSTDKSLSILKEFEKKDSRIKVLTQKNSKQGVARNLGLSIAKGEYIFFLDSDDYLNTDILEKLYDKIQKTKSDIVVSQLLAFDDSQNNDLKKHTKERNEFLQEFAKNIYENFQITIDTFSYAIDKIPCVPVGRLYSKKFLDTHQIKFIDKPVIHEDNGFWLKICANFPTISSISDVGIMCRTRENCTTEYTIYENLKHIKFYNMRIVLKDVISYIKQNCDINLAKKLISKIENSYEYTQFYEHSWKSLYKLKWTSDEKYLYVLKLRLFKITQNQTLKQYNILGIKFIKNIFSVKFSVVLPTMQKNITVLNMLLKQLTENKFVDEIILIDNSLKGINCQSEKIKVITPTQNLYVNSTWNLGVEIAKNEYIAILNDDLILPTKLFYNIAKFMYKTTDCGLIGIDDIPKSSLQNFKTYPKNKKIKFVQTNKRYENFGIAMFLKKQNYVNIPEEMKIWCGDDFLFYKMLENKCKNYFIENSNIQHLHSLTSALPEFDKIKENDVKIYTQINPNFKVYAKPKNHVSFLEHIFSVKNELINDKKHKVIRIFGVKMILLKRGT